MIARNKLRRLFVTAAAVSGAFIAGCAVGGALGYAIGAPFA